MIVRPVSMVSSAVSSKAVPARPRLWRRKDEDKARVQVKKESKERRCFGYYSRERLLVYDAPVD